MGRLRDERGFSLLELLIVLAIIACLAVVAAPVYASQRTRLEDVLLIANSRNLATPVPERLDGRERRAEDVAAVGSEIVVAR